MARRALETFARVVAWTLLVLASLCASVLYHLQLHAARDELRDLVCALASEALRGELRIGSIDEIAPSEVVARDVEILDEEGRVVIAARDVSAELDFGALLRDG